jgi:hypothetical protein
MAFRFGSVYVRDRNFGEVRDALVELMAETERRLVRARGLDPTPNDTTSAKKVRSFALLPAESGWITVLEDGHPLDDGGIAEGLSDLLQAEVIHFIYDDVDGMWEFEYYSEGQPLESGGADDEDYDVSAADFIDNRSLPHFGVYYEEVAAAAGESQPVLAGALGYAGAIVARVPMGTEVLTFKRFGVPHPE